MRLKTSLLAVTALACALVSVPASAATIQNLGVDPTSATGAFNHSVGGGAFSDQLTFTLAGGPAFLTIASVTNVFPQPTDFISNFTGSVFFSGANGVPGGGDDVLVIGPVLATACNFVQNCQGFAGSAILTMLGNYYLNVSGTGGGTSGYGGNLAVSQVPIPGALLLFGSGLAGLGWLGFKRKDKNSALGA